MEEAKCYETGKIHLNFCRTFVGHVAFSLFTFLQLKIVELTIRKYCLGIRGTFKATIAVKKSKSNVITKSQTYPFGFPKN